MPSDCTRFSLSPKQLLDEVHDAQAALAAAEYYISCSLQKISLCSHFYATHEALHEARKTIDRVIEMLRVEAADRYSPATRNRKLPTDGE